MAEVLTNEEERKIQITSQVAHSLVLDIEGHPSRLHLYFHGIHP